MTSITGGLIDDLETEFRKRYQRRLNGDLSASEQPITSGELAAKYGVEDTNGNPKTREAIKIVKRQRGLPVIGGSTGYYIPVDPTEIDDYCETLQSRIDGIAENQQLMRENWRAWRQGRADDEPPEQPATDGGAELSAAEQRFVENNPITADELLAKRRGDGDA